MSMVQGVGGVREAFWSELSGCVEERKRSGCQIIVLEDLNARAENDEVHGEMEKHGVPGRNNSGDRLLETCSEMELVVGNTYFRMERKSKFTLQMIDNGRLVERAMMDYVLVEKSVLGRLVDVHVARGAGGIVSVQFVVVAKVKEGG